MKKINILILALLGALVWTGCEKERLVDESLIDKGGVKDSVWTLTIHAERHDAPLTKGLSIGAGDEVTTTTLQSIWKDGDAVKVYLEDACIGTLTATPDGGDAHIATLSGTITTTGITPDVTRLTLLTPRENIDYTGQVGKLLITDDPENSIEAKYHYTIAENILVTGVSGNEITTEHASFVNLQSIYRLSFRFQNGGVGEKTAINTKSVSVSGSGCHLVQHQLIGYVVPTEGNITVTLTEATTNPFFVAISNGFANGNEEVFTFTVVDADGVSYRGSKTIPADYNYNGSFVSVKNATLTSRLAVPLSATPVDAVL